MKKSKLLSVVLLATIAVDFVSPILSSKNDYAKKLLINAVTVNANETTTGVNIYDEEKLDEFISNPDEVVTTDGMTASEFEIFQEVVYAEAQSLGLPTQEDVEVYAQAIIELYTPSSSNYTNLTETTDQIIAAIDENHENVFDTISGEEALAAAHGWILKTKLKIMAGLNGGNQ